MNPAIAERILHCTESTSIVSTQLVQALWSNFGAIERIFLSGGNVASVIVKRIQIPSEMLHPRGWNSEISTQRKLKSYEIERHWYHNYASNLPESIRVPKFLFQEDVDDETYIVMEDLHTAGFQNQFGFTGNSFDACLQWLANLHAFHLGVKPNGLWEIGTYWHLETRPEELNRMQSGPLKDIAYEIDQKLNRCNFQTLVHGDAKPANFCFANDGLVAAVDFQYVGGGCGIKDVVYLMSSALSESELFRKDEKVLERYFSFLEIALKQFGRTAIDFRAVKSEWLSLYAIAWIDFLRFLEGWSPGHSRSNRYAMQQFERFQN